MNLNLFKTKKGKCDACREETQDQEILEKIKINGFEVFFCSDCIIGQRDSSQEENEEFIKIWTKRNTKNL
jgi:hypothetical protein